MAFTTPFRTASEIVPCKNLQSETIFPVALDIGYSAVKGFAPFSRFCIPSFVKELPGEIIGNPQASDLLYKGEDGIVYSVGSMAINSLSTRDTNDASNTLFGRNRYFSTPFLILARVGIAIAIKRNTFGGYKKDKPLFLQTGLPPAYRKADTALLKEALSGLHKFSLKLGGGGWSAFEFYLEPNRISVIDQPIGSVYSASKSSDGKTVTAYGGKTYIDSRTLVLDGGFGTLDIFSVVNRSIDGSNTFNDLGMKAIFECTAEDIFTQYGKELYAHTMQQFLETGIISVLNRRTHATDEYDISDILERNTKAMCVKALRKIEAAYDDLVDYNYLIVTGGTGAAWLPYIKERYKNMDTLQIVPANQNENIAPIYNNVRGYYIFRGLAGLR